MTVLNQRSSGSGSKGTSSSGPFNPDAAHAPSDRRRDQASGEELEEEGPGAWDPLLRFFQEAQSQRGGAPSPPPSAGDGSPPVDSNPDDGTEASCPPTQGNLSAIPKRFRKMLIALREQELYVRRAELQTQIRTLNVLLTALDQNAPTRVGLQLAVTVLEEALLTTPRPDSSPTRP